MYHAPLAVDGNKDCSGALRLRSASISDIDMAGDKGSLKGPVEAAGISSHSGQETVGIQFLAP